MKKFILQTIAFFLFLIFSDLVKAQDDMTIYNLSSVPQSNYDNPAFMPDCKFHIGCLPIVFVPILSSNYTNISNSGFRWDNAIREDKAKDSLYLDINKLLDGLSKKNYLSINQQIELISFGFKIKRTHYVNFSLTETFNFRFCYPKDFLLLANGNSQFIGSEANLNGVGIDITHCREFAIGYTNQIDKKWTVGGKAKLLFGLSNMWTKESKATLSVDNDYYDLTANSNLVVFTSAPEKLYDTFNDTTGNTSITKQDFSKYMLNFNNPGFGIDLGVNYKLNEKWSFAGSIIDFGYIFWKTGTRKFTSADTSFTFRGIDINEMIRNDTIKFPDVLRKLVDSIGNIFKIDEKNKNYASPLCPKIYLSATYTISKKDRVSFIFRGDIYKKNIHPAFSLAYNRKFGNIIDLAISYSYMNKDFLNLGFGSSVRFGPFQIFLASDNILATIIPYHTKNINVHFGCNYVFNYKKSYPLMK
ncbi:MAG: DUF5723 family protein [Bacteroidota bacterium]